jgi:hypothetical protein
VFQYLFVIILFDTLIISIIPETIGCSFLLTEPAVHEKYYYIFYACSPSFSCTTASADDDTDTQALVDQSTILFKSFGQDSDMNWFHNRV